MEVKTDCCSKKQVPVAPKSVSIEEVIVNGGIYKLANGSGVYAITASCADTGIKNTLYFNQAHGHLEPIALSTWRTEKFVPLRNATLCIHVEE